MIIFCFLCVDDGVVFIDVWCCVVDVIYDFFSVEDWQVIDVEVVSFLLQLLMIVVVDVQDWLVGFMLIDGMYMEVLFIDLDVCGIGIGWQLL